MQWVKNILPVTSGHSLVCSGVCTGTQVTQMSFPLCVWLVLLITVTESNSVLCLLIRDWSSPVRLDCHTGLAWPQRDATVQTSRRDTGRGCSSSHPRCGGQTVFLRAVYQWGQRYRFSWKLIHSCAHITCIWFDMLGWVLLWDLWFWVVSWLFSSRGETRAGLNEP